MRCSKQTEEAARSVVIFCTKAVLAAAFVFMVFVTLCVIYAESRGLPAHTVSDVISAGWLPVSLFMATVITIGAWANGYISICRNE